ncbi:Major facilitator superfamily transporter [Fusarium austroafricanum]|uniref:Major facilitator superfamily transporter n=1 Tax=Fusarium austroafricanum TaxID=2364996 RepID=A0A8H4NV79_9HYPO|nr:Major facilitator superfamily transporter [Fusarium austroafricanum]
MDSTTPLLPQDRNPSHSYICDLPKSSQKSSSQAERNKSLSSPKFQILLLCFARLMEPMAFFSIFPYIAQMVERNGKLPEAEIGFYSGLIESLFSATQALVLVFWGSMADRVGGKTMLVWSLLGTAAGSVLFGFASSLWTMTLFRCFTGLVSGGNVVIRAMIGERCTTAESRTQAFSWYSLAGNLALFLGPLIGGALANPASQYPAVCKGIELFESFPFALPGIAVGVLSAMSAIVIAFCVDEAEQEKQSISDADPSATSSGLDWALIWELIKAPGVSAMLCAFVHVMLIGSAFMAVGSLTLYTGVGRGGMGFSAHQIAMYMTVQGAAEAVWLLLVFPPLHRRLGTRGIIFAGVAAFPLFFAGYILMNAFLRNGSSAAFMSYQVVLGAMALLGPGVFMVITAVQLGLQEVSPSPRTLGTLNAIAESASSLVRSVVPAISTMTFAVGVRDQIMDGYLVWVILILLGGSLAISVTRLPGRSKV